MRGGGRRDLIDTRDDYMAFFGQLGQILFREHNHARITLGHPMARSYD